MRFCRAIWTASIARSFLHGAEACGARSLGRALIADAARRWRGMGRRALMGLSRQPALRLHERIGGAVVAEVWMTVFPMSPGWRDLGGLLNAPWRCGSLDVCGPPPSPPRKTVEGVCRSLPSTVFGEWRGGGPGT